MSGVEVEYLAGLGVGGAFSNGESSAPADPPVCGSLEDLGLDLDSEVDMKCEDALIVSNLFLFVCNKFGLFVAILSNFCFADLNLLFMWGTYQFCEFFWVWFLL